MMTAAWRLRSASRGASGVRRARLPWPPPRWTWKRLKGSRMCVCVLLWRTVPRRPWPWLKLSLALRRPPSHMTSLVANLPLRGTLLFLWAARLLARCCRRPVVRPPPALRPAPLAQTALRSPAPALPLRSLLAVLAPPTLRLLAPPPALPSLLVTPPRPFLLTRMSCKLRLALEEKVE